MMLRSILTVTLLSAAFALAACESGEKADGPTTGPSTTSPAALGVLNDSCPIMGEEVDPNVTVNYGGAKVGFCCRGCVSKWNDMSDEAKREFVAKQK